MKDWDKIDARAKARSEIGWEIGRHTRRMIDDANARVDLLIKQAEQNGEEIDARQIGQTAAFEAARAHGLSMRIALPHEGGNKRLGKK